MKSYSKSAGLLFVLVLFGVVFTHEESENDDDLLKDILEFTPEIIEQSHNVHNAIANFQISSKANNEAQPSARRLQDQAPSNPTNDTQEIEDLLKKLEAEIAEITSKYNSLENQAQSDVPITVAAPPAAPAVSTDAIPAEALVAAPVAVPAKRRLQNMRSPFYSKRRLEQIKHTDNYRRRLQNIQINPSGLITMTPEPVTHKHEDEHKYKNECEHKHENELEHKHEDEYEHKHEDEHEHEDESESEHEHEVCTAKELPA
jgi:hypothetical protein